MQINGNSVEFSYGGLDEAFPPCDAGARPVPDTDTQDDD